MVSDTQTVRSVFIINPELKIRLTISDLLTVGRNFVEILRVIDALQLTDKVQVATPADWRAGDCVLIRPSVSDQATQRLFPQGWDAHRPYLRLTKLSN